MEGNLIKKTPCYMSGVHLYNPRFVPLFLYAEGLVPVFFYYLDQKVFFTCRVSSSTRNMFGDFGEERSIHSPTCLPPVFSEKPAHVHPKVHEREKRGQTEI